MEELMSSEMAQGYAAWASAMRNLKKECLTGKPRAAFLINEIVFIKEALAKKITPPDP